MRFRRPRSKAPVPAAAPADLGAATALGRRAENQDRWFVGPGLALVSDGMGGHRGGALAAELTVAAVAAALDGRAPGGARSTTDLLDAFDRANAAVRAVRDEQVEVAEMGATLTVALLTDTAPERSRWSIAHVGDSPAFHVSADATTVLTADHTPAAELVALGVLTEAQAAGHPTRHQLLRAIGPDPILEVDLAEVDLVAGDALVLASDGLSGTIAADEIGAIVRSAASAATAAEALVEAAVAGGASDNVTAVVVRQVPSSAR